MPPQRVCQDAPSVFLSGTDYTEYCGYAFGELMEIRIIPTLYIYVTVNRFSSIRLCRALERGSAY